ncbi:hypothetical protein ACLOJK_007502 [Asimina triloba]
MGGRYTGVVDQFGFTDIDDIMGDRLDMANIKPGMSSFMEIEIKLDFWMLKNSIRVDPASSESPLEG